MLSEETRAHRFLDLTGLTPEGLRAAVGEPAMHKAVLDFLAAHEPDLLAAAEALQITPESFVTAHKDLSR